MEVEIEPEHLFSLRGCLNLSELILDMERSESCAVQDSISILSTLNPAQSGHLAKIVVMYSYVGRWFNEGCVDSGEDSDEDCVGSGKKDWEGFDTVLSKLANASSDTRGERLTFTLVVTRWCDNGNLIPTVREWLPKQLPRFNGLGLLHVR